VILILNHFVTADFDFK